MSNGCNFDLFSFYRILYHPFRHHVLNFCALFVDFFENSFINKSLLTLGTVISNLSDGKNTAHIPYRDSKLTRLLASALGGNAKTCLITCISPAYSNLVESQSTLRFATRAKRIVNYAQKNEFEEAKSLATKFAQQKAELDEVLNYTTSPNQTLTASHSY